MTTRVAITGASGMIGRALSMALRASGDTVVTIGRGPENDVRWDPRTGEIAPERLEGIDAVVNLAGANVGQRWTTTWKRAILESRTQSTTCIARSISALRAKPRVLVSASAVGFYGSRGDEWLTESSAPGTDVLSVVSTQWEAAAAPAREARIRVVHPRIGVVLTASGGALAKLLPVFKLGAGAPLGSGRQWMSWITLTDAVRVIQFAIAEQGLHGAVNAVSPNPVSNAEFTSSLAEALHRPVLLPAVPAIVLRAMLGEMAEGTLLASQRVRPARLLDGGFAFQDTTIGGALRELLSGSVRQ